jgi:hypothetical protein
MRSGTVLGLLAMLTACTPEGLGTPATRFEPGGDPRVPLVVTAHVTTAIPTRLTIVLDDGTEERRISRWPDLATEREALVLGFHPATSYVLWAEVEAADGRRAASAPWSWTTPPLPDSFPPLEVTVARPALMEPGVTLIPCERWPDRGNPDHGFGAIVALDASGEVVWFYEAPHAISLIRRSRAGHLLYLAGTRGHAIEMDMTGRIVRQWVTTRLPGTELPAGAIPVDASTLHHELFELPDGDLVSLTTELRRFESYPASEDDPTVPRRPARVVGDVILRFRPDGTVVDRIPVLDLLDPYRIGYESLDWGFWQGIYEHREEEPLRDWAHVNSVDLAPGTNQVIVSSYHQDAVFAFDLDTREVAWILGFPTGWGERWMQKVLNPVGDGLYPFHQHAARMTPAGTLLMFDNGKYRALPYAPKMPPEQSFSRAVEFAIDPTTLEFRQLWTYGGRPDEHFFTPFLGETDWLSRTGNVLVTDGGRVVQPDGRPGFHPAQGRKWARVAEVTRTTPADVVFEVVIDDPTCGWTVYRSERLEDLYP